MFSWGFLPVSLMTKHSVSKLLPTAMHFFVQSFMEKLEVALYWCLVAIPLNLKAVLPPKRGYINSYQWTTEAWRQPRLMFSQTKNKKKFTKRTNNVHETSRWVSPIGPLPNILAGVVSFCKPSSETPVFCNTSTTNLVK